MDGREGARRVCGVKGKGYECIINKSGIAGADL